MDGSVETAALSGINDSGIEGGERNAKRGMAPVKHEYITSDQSRLCNNPGLLESVSCSNPPLIRSTSGFELMLDG